MKEYVSSSKLMAAYKECKKNKTNSIYCQEFMINESEKLSELKNDLNRDKYEISRSITFINTIPKPREIFAANFRDRIVHHLICKEFDEAIESSLVDEAYSCRIGKGTLSAIKKLQQDILEESENYTKPIKVITGDLSNFFMSIDKDILYESTSNIIKSTNHKDEEYWLNLMYKIIYNNPTENCIKKSPEEYYKLFDPIKSLFTCDINKGLPIGNLPSQKLANVYLTPMDKFILERCKRYGRYVDDFYLVTSIDFDVDQFIIDLRIFIISNLKIDLSLHKIKVHTTIDCIHFLGARVMKGRTLPTIRTINAFRDVVKYYENFLCNNVPNSEALIYIRSSINSYLGILIQFDSYRLRKNILNTYFGINLRKYFNIENYTKINLYK